MYYPILRGRVFELKAIRDFFERKGNGENIVPIIEPVKYSTKNLEKTVIFLAQQSKDCILIVNPIVGEEKLLVNKSKILDEMLTSISSEINNNILQVAYNLSKSTRQESIKQFLNDYQLYDKWFIHYEYNDWKFLTQELKRHKGSIKGHIFMDGCSKKLYRKKFIDDSSGPDDSNQRLSVLIRDGFNKQDRNDLYPEEEHFSELHATFKVEGANGFGDFLIVGDHFQTSGGLPYTLTIHLTYIMDDEDMNIRHFSSSKAPDSGFPRKLLFQEAQSKMVKWMKEKGGTENITSAYEELASIRFPGFGYIKKLCMLHHMELLDRYLKGRK